MKNSRKTSTCSYLLGNGPNRGSDRVRRGNKFKILNEITLFAWTIQSSVCFLWKESDELIQKPQYVTILQGGPFRGKMHEHSQLAATSALPCGLRPNTHGNVVLSFWYAVYCPYAAKNCNFLTPLSFMRSDHFITIIINADVILILIIIVNNTITTIHHVI